MDIHKPKPWHGLREFLKEYIIIVAGVLTALAGEQAAEWFHWRHEVTEGREGLHREMALDAGYFRARLKTKACLDRRLDLMGSALDAAASGKPTPVDTPLAGPGSLLITSQWSTEQASQTAIHFPREELSELGVWYEQTAIIKGWIENEEDAWAKLAALKAPKGLGPADLALLRQDLQRARYLHFLVNLNTQRQLDRAKALGVEPGTAMPGATVDTYVRFQCG